MQTPTFALKPSWHGVMQSRSFPRASVQAVGSRFSPRQVLLYAPRSASQPRSSRQSRLASCASNSQSPDPLSLLHVWTQESGFCARATPVGRNAMAAPRVEYQINLLIFLSSVFHFSTHLGRAREWETRSEQKLRPPERALRKRVRAGGRMSA